MAGNYPASYQTPSHSWYTNFSLRRVYVAGGAGALTASVGSSVTSWIRVPGILGMVLTPNAKSVDQFGDDGLVGIWVYDARATCELTTSMLAQDFYSIMTANTTSSATVGGQVVQTYYFGSDLEHSPPHFFVRGFAAARQEDSRQNASMYCRYTLFNCQLSNVLVPEAAEYGKLHEQRYRIEVLPGYVDERGITLSGLAGPGAIFALGKMEEGLAAYPQDVPGGYLGSGGNDNTFGQIYG